MIVGFFRSCRPAKPSGPSTYEKKCRPGMTANLTGTARKLNMRTIHRPHEVVQPDLFEVTRLLDLIDRSPNGCTDEAERWVQSAENEARDDRNLRRWQSSLRGTGRIANIARRMTGCSAEAAQAAEDAVQDDRSRRAVETLRAYCRYRRIGGVR